MHLTALKTFTKVSRVARSRWIWLSSSLFRYDPQMAGVCLIPFCCLLAQHSTLTQQEACKVGRSPSGLAALRGRAAEGQMSGEDCNLTSIMWMLLVTQVVRGWINLTRDCAKQHRANLWHTFVDDTFVCACFFTKEHKTPANDDYKDRTPNFFASRALQLGFGKLTHNRYCKGNLVG